VSARLAEFLSSLTKEDLLKMAGGLREFRNAEEGRAATLGVVEAAILHTAECPPSPPGFECRICAAVKRLLAAVGQVQP